MTNQKIDGTTPNQQRPTIHFKEKAPLEIPDLDQRSMSQNTLSNAITGDNTDESSLVGAAGLSIILGQLVVYFSGRAHVDDMDVLSFSLHHLFRRANFLYLRTLPELLGQLHTGRPQGQESLGDSPPLLYDGGIAPRIVGAGDPVRTLPGRLVMTGNAPAAVPPVLGAGVLTHDRHVWTQLRAIKQTVDRIEPLCHLLSDATACMLDTLDMTSEATSTGENPALELSPRDEKQQWLQSLDQERWERALTALTESLSCWQERHSQQALFATQFEYVIPAISSLPQLDIAFTILLNSVGAIFGDIMPGFQALSIGDDEAVATLLFDLMQQADQVLAQFDTILEPLHMLLEHFALETR